MRFYFVILFITFFISCGQDKDHAQHTEAHKSESVTQQETRSASTIAMANALKDLSASTTSINSYKSTQRAKTIYDAAQNLDINNKINQLVLAAYQLLLSGDVRKTLTRVDEIDALIKANNITLNSGGRNRIDMIRSLAYLRMGEIENCLHNHSEHSCIIPLDASSYHELEEGSTEAIALFKKILATKRDLNFAWLLNIGYMTLGKYPEQVPKEFLIPLSPQEKQGLLPKFKNVASLLNIDDNKLSGGVIIDDLNGNGFPDIMVSSWDLDHQLFFYVNNGDGTFTNKYLEAGLEGITGGLNMIHADYNNDGHLDIFILRGAWMSYGNFPNSLLKNNGDGTFSDVTKASGIYSLHPTQTACFADFNNDGHLDVFIGNESMQGINNSCELFVSNGDGTFTEKAASLNANIVGFVKGVTTSDYDNDGDVDIFLSLNGAENILLKNDLKEGSFKFSDVSKAANIKGPIESFPTWFFDYNNDGFEDIFVSGFSMKNYNNLSAEYAKEMLNLPFDAETPALYRNNGNGTFEDVSNKVGLDKVCFTMGSSFGDLNNDGYLDFYLGTGEPDLKAIIPNRMFLNIDGNKFEEVTMQGGFGHIQKGHAISFADIDYDGDQDVYAVMGGAYEGDVFYNALFENPGNENHWLKIKLIGTKTNKSAFDTKLEIVLNSGKGKRSIYRRVSSGSSFGENPNVVEVGFRSDENIETIKIDWPLSGIVEHKDIESNTFYAITEGEELLEKIPIRPIKLKLNSAHHHHH